MLIKLLRLSLGVIFIWYGILKFFPELSPAEALATKTIDILFFSYIPSTIAMKILAMWEVLIGIGFLLGIYLRVVVVFFIVHMVLTFTPLFLLSDICFTQAPFAFTLVGQYIVKNIVFILVGLLIYQNEEERIKLHA